MTPSVRRAWQTALHSMGVVMALAATLLAAGCGGSRSASGNDVSVTASGPSNDLTPGATAVFTLTVENAGPRAASDVQLVNELSSYLALQGITCQAYGGATCPDTVASRMAVPTLPAGGRLVFTVTAIVNVITGGTASDTMVATVVDDTGRLNNTATASVNVVATPGTVGVAQDASATAAAGSSTTFKVVVSNPSGSTVAGNLVLQWSVAAPFDVSGITYTCTAVGGSTCPASVTPAASMSFSVPTLGAGRSLNFIFTVPIPASGRGNVVSTASITADGDSDTGNNVSVVTTVASDARNGTYQVVAADGRPYQLAIDFDAGSYTMSGNGTSVTKTFTSNGAGGYVVNGTEQLRTAEDLVVGSHAFADGVLPFVAARNFATSVDTVTGAFDIMLRNTPADGTAAVTHVGTARATGNTLQVCIDDYEVVQAQTCSVGSLKSYVMSISDDVVTASDSSGTAVFSFRLARSGAARIILAAGTSFLGDGSRQMTIGVSDSAGLVDSTVYGPGVFADATNDWLTLTIGRAQYTAEGSNASGIADVSGLYVVSVDGAVTPTAMLQGAPLPFLNGAPIWVMQAYPLVVVVGAPKSGPEEANASGLMQIGLP